MPSPQTHRTSLGETSFQLAGREPGPSSPRAVNRDDCGPRPHDRPRQLLGPPVRVRERPHRPGVLDRDDGRADLPVVGPDDSPRRVARRLV